ITRFLGFILFVLFIIYKFILIKGGLNESGDEPDYPLVKSIFIFCLSLVVLIASSRLLVFEAVNLAPLLGISTRFISLFAVAFGTSLPELVTTVRFIKKGYNDIVVGNVFGSNLFNTAFVLPFSWIVSPVLFDSLYFLELGIVLIASLLLFYLTKFTKESSKWLGYLFLLIYIIYIIYIYLNSHL
ncbi:MAG: sodium:calcium antiporter, partial [Candidatus Margulisiibacteriota bacterium]|nr:sodium:calcium antiporter [Candidatus Margulisiibacteriota bacterium]